MGYGSTVIRKGVTVFQLYLNPKPSSVLQQFQDFSSLIGPSRSTTSWNYVSCRRYMKEWEGSPAHLHRNVILLVKALFSRVQWVFFPRLFFLHLLWDHMEFPSLCVCLLWMVVVGIRVERHSLLGLQLLHVFTCQLFK